MTEGRLFDVLANGRDPLGWLAAADMIEESGRPEDFTLSAMTLRRRGEWGRILLREWMRTSWPVGGVTLTLPGYPGRVEIRWKPRTVRLTFWLEVVRSGWFGPSFNYRYAERQHEFVVVMHRLFGLMATKTTETIAVSDWRYLRGRIRDICDYFLFANGAGR